MSESISMNDINLASFLNESDSDEEIFVEKEKHSNIIREKICEISQMQLKNRFSYASVGSVVKLMNDIPGTQIQIPQNKKKNQKMAAQSTTIVPIYFVICNKCSELTEDGGKCQCGAITKKESKTDNFIVYFPLVPQICQILRKHFQVIMEYMNRQHCVDSISDVDDGKLFKNLSMKEPSMLLTLTMNVDGANIFRSSHASLWPVQFYLNFLPPALRYLPENIVVTTFYYGQKKPDMTTLLLPTAKELDFYDESISIKTSANEILSFRLVVLIIACDLPARTAVQNFIGPNGKYGCPFCFHPGVPVKNLSGKSTNIRYVHLAEGVECRKHKETLIESTKCGEKNVIKGIKGPSPALMFTTIDVIDSFSIDYMHAIPLGIMKDLIQIWIGKRRLPTPPYAQYMIKKQKDREILKHRILKLKPPMSIRRKPRSILDVANFKATELLNCMWFYLRYALPGILPTRIVKHFEMLSAGTYILCKEQIQLSEVEFACDLLRKFATEFEDIYGKGSITMNIHLLKHYHQMILNCGPLWCHSLFGFENNIGVLKQFVCGKTDVLEQIAKKYAISKIERESLHLLEETLILKDRIKTNVNEKYLPLMLKAGYIMNENDNLQIWRRLKMHGEDFTAIESHQKKSCDYFVQTKTNQIGVVLFYIKRQREAEFLLQIYKVNDTNYHWMEVIPTEEFEIHLCSEIDKKLMFFEGFNTMFVSKMPNRYIRSVC